MDKFKIKNKILSDILLEGDNTNVEKIYDYITLHFNFSEMQQKAIQEKINQSFMPTFKKKYRKAIYNKNRFQSNNKNWLDSDFIADFASKKRGRKSLEFDECSRSVKWRKSNSLRDIYSDNEIQNAFLTGLRNTGKSALANTISRLLRFENDETTNAISGKNIIQFTDYEALTLFEDAKLTKYQYEIIRLHAMAKNADIFPTYKKLSEVKKTCFPSPDAFQISEAGAEINLQQLLDHTINRILLIPSVELAVAVQNKSMSLRLISKWGCDGASGQSRYKQKFVDETLSDESIFMISMVPLRLEICISSVWKELWKNPRPSSTKYCRPIKFEYASESKQKIIVEVNRIKKQINNLVPTIIDNNTSRYEVKHEMILTMIDGKVCQALTGTPSASTCVICGAKPSEMNDISKLKHKQENVHNFQYGLSTLHAWIRFMECILHISYRLNFCKWAAKEPEDQMAMKKAKKNIQKEFRKQMALYVDIPKQGSGSTNNGNTARRFFRDPNMTSKITGIDEGLIRRFGIILQTLACGKNINIAKFESYALETAELYIKLYPWYYMPSSVHKILFHGSKIIDSYLLPIGELSEEAQEARNKDFKRFREYHTRKHCRSATNEDIIKKLLTSSDPYISSQRNEWKRSLKTIDIEAQKLLLDFSDEINTVTYEDEYNYSLSLA